MISGTGVKAAAPASPGPHAAVREALDVLLYDDPSGPKKRKTIVELQQLVQKADFAEQFLEEDGLNVIVQQVKQTSGNIQGALLTVLKHLLVYVNAIEQVAESPDLVEKIYGLLIPSSDGTPVSLSVAKPTLEILIVICGVLETGHKLINQAAKKRIGVGLQPYSPLIPLLSCDEFTTIHSTLVFMNMLLKKKKAAADLKAKKLYFRWKECGIISLLQRIASMEDEEIQKQLSLLQRMANFTIPRSWEEASKFKQMYEEAKRKLDVSTEALFVYQQQQAKMRLLKMELQRAQETLRALSIILPASSTAYHPSRRFRDGGGLPAGALVSTALEPIDATQASKDISDVRRKVFDHFVQSSDFRPLVEKVVGPSFAGRAGRGARRYDDDMIMAPDDDEAPPPSDDEPDEPPPPDDDDDAPPPADDDDDGPSVPGGTGKSSGGTRRGPGAGQRRQGGGGGAGGPDDDDVPPPADDDEAPRAPSAPTGTAGASSPAHVDPSAAPRLGEIDATAAAVASPPSPSAPVVATPTAAPGGAPPLPGKAPPPPPPPPGKRGGIPPPPGARAGASGPAAPKDTRVFYRGPAPQKKMKPLHWDKIDLPDTGATVWHRIYAGSDIDTTFDYEEFENLFSQKEVEAKKEVAPKPKKIMLLEEGIHRNLSIVLHKLPSIPNVQRALNELDGEVLNREALVAMAAQAPTDEVKKAFLANATKKPEDEYEPPEKYMAMMLTMPEFKKRVTCWLFTMEWGDSTQAVMKPILRLSEAISAVLESPSLPFYLGLLLGFGNMMNYGDARKGNAAAISLGLLGKLELTKDNRGKTSIVGHLFHTIKTHHPSALSLPDELKPLTNNLTQIKWEDVEKSVKEAEAAVQIFQTQCAAVKRKLVEVGSDRDDPFIPITTEFYSVASSELKKIQDDFALLKEQHLKLLQYFGITDVKKKPEEIFSELVPFVDKMRKAAQDLAKDSRRNAKKGQKLGDGQLSDVVGKLQEQIASV